MTTRDVFLVQKEPGAALVWVEQDDFGRMPKYDIWSVHKRRTIGYNDPLPKDIDR